MKSGSKETVIAERHEEDDEKDEMRFYRKDELVAKYPLSKIEGWKVQDYRHPLERIMIV